MAEGALSSARWQYCGEPDKSQRAVLVQFSNGKLRNPGNMRFTLYKNDDSTNPRKRSQRILAAETDRLSYVGNNFGTGALKCNTLCRHFVGILNKTSGQMEVYDAELFSMQPLFSDESVESESTLESQTKTFREKMDSCIEVFGTTKQKRALNSRRMNRVGSESLNCVIAKAAENIIDAKGVTALVSDAIHDDLQDDSLCLPPCHADAVKPEDVYKLEDILSPAEYEALQGPCEAFRNVSSEELLRMTEENSHCSFVIEALKSLPSGKESRDHQARCIWFLDTLIKFRAQKVIKRKSALGPGIPHVINMKLLKHFTCLAYNNGSLRNLISDSMKAKIAAYVIILALHINDFQIDLTMLQRDLKLSEKRMIEIAKAMRLKISKRKVSLAAAGEEDHKLGTLSIPLPPAQTSDRPSKRKKIT
ncbi:DNA-directed RNA polymerase I subunit RPA49 [Manis pentadactyla]|uniref:DNA-directed RNA polymerase I subunit RPA49 n=1 Tax=Manis pentadactyla TaxID=143292 RepID=UPI001877379E|nr:DNA-directed RNA polymerase I subunit RPA49 [Manis pentadactyla]XP_036744228.1 DNA-directed RNA polymerase I subunit RPA49 [Manis pentadactyla]XP_036744230.1 DNA-directed RNA polymerase I subunit RPA49 [Manis pentadactyla]XP_036744231.1 DNA-directed RNA polymerase I subunit RPA49 [Manis pentadactyla]XP_057354846.1 DNA-directed RNA polymerase I subunit RPA49 [Manis pentadactyla]KAI5158304.1 Dna-Directed Rna polymerase I Subunit Rpa49 [Manis pentadactyla]